MKIITGEFHVVLPETANEPYGVYLTRSRFEPVALVYTQEENTLTISPPAEVAKGVWQLVVNTSCGCFITPVYVDCPAPQMQGEHQPTNALPPTIVCCDTP